MDYQYLLGGILACYACSLAFLFVLYSFAAKRNATSSSLLHLKSNGSAKTSENGICQQKGEGSIDVIIVGAGVAGAALAYTLGKVWGFFFLPKIYSGFLVLKIVVMNEKNLKVDEWKQE